MQQQVELPIEQEDRTIVRLSVEDLLLDPENPRLASGATKENPSQLDLMKVLWTEMAVDELVLSIAANGYFPEEPLFVIPKNPEDPDTKYVVVEGNRRLAAVRILLYDNLRKKLRAFNMPEIDESAKKKLRKLPVSIYDNREQLWTYLSFRHINTPKRDLEYPAIIEKADMLELPNDFEDVLALADWMELIALESGDRNASAGDLVNALQIPAGKDKANELSLEVMVEIEDRIDATGDAYPFHLYHGRVLQTKDNLHEYVAYLFCLILSYFGWEQIKGASINPRLLFEELACIAARQYIRGEVVQFGTGRRASGVSAFSEAVEHLCRKLGEGKGIRTTETLSKNDDHVDLVAWRDFQDGRPSKLILFGQCATGANWDSKISELQPEAFWSHWMLEGQISPLGRSFYIPHRIPYERDGERWKYYSRYAQGILFDRCRVAYWAWTDNDTLLRDPRYIK